jgi:hypothetical protein
MVLISMGGFRFLGIRVDSKSKTKGKDMKDEIIWRYDKKKYENDRNGKRRQQNGTQEQAKDQEKDCRRKNKKMLNVAKKRMMFVRAKKSSGPVDRHPFHC